MRRKVKYPTCSQCGHELNPVLEDDCEKYYLVEGETYCKYCFQDWVKNQVDKYPDDLADALNIMKVYVEEWL